MSYFIKLLCFFLMGWTLFRAGIMPFSLNGILIVGLAAIAAEMWRFK